MLPVLATPRSCQMTTEAANTSMMESSPKPTNAIEPAATPAQTAMTASTRFQAIVRYSSRNARRCRDGDPQCPRDSLVGDLLARTAICRLQLEGAVFDVEVPRQARAQSVEDTARISGRSHHDMG